MADKLFFLDKVDASLFVDIGCADASVIKQAALMFPEYTFYGIDNNEEMCELAKQNVEKVKNVSILNNISNLRMCLNGRKSCIILSSMIHELYAYEPQHVKSFWETIFGLNADYISIRDMCVGKSASRPADPISVARVRQCYDGNKIAQWEAKWGSLSENWSLVNFLLHYQYVENWEREHQENYLPLSKEDLLALIPKKYFPIFVEHYTLPYIRQSVMRDFGVQLQEPTHLKLILKNTTATD